MKEFILAKDELKIMLEMMPKEGVVLLQGDLASGKTSLVQAWTQFLGLDARVDSPLLTSKEIPCIILVFLIIFSKFTISNLLINFILSFIVFKTNFNLCAKNSKFH